MKERIRNIRKKTDDAQKYLTAYSFFPERTKTKNLTWGTNVYQHIIVSLKWSNKKKNPVRKTWSEHALLQQ